MKLLRHADLDDLLVKDAIEHLDWPRTQAELDDFLSRPATECIPCTDTQEVGHRPSSSASSTTPVHVQENGQLPLFNVLPSSELGMGQRRALSLNEVVRQAYLQVYAQCSIDRVIADPDHNARFIQTCWKLDAQAPQDDLNRVLLNARKNGLIGKVEGVKPYRVPRDVVDQYLFASECAVRLIQDREYYEHQRSVTLDYILCDPELSRDFEQIAKMIAPGFSALDYRWAALVIRKGQNRQQKVDPSLGSTEWLGTRDVVLTSRIEKSPGVFWMICENTDVYIGHTANLRLQIERMLDLKWENRINEIASPFVGRLGRVNYGVTLCSELRSASVGDWLKARLVREREPKLNLLRRGLVA